MVMGKKTNGIFIPYSEKELYSIFKDLEHYGRTSYTYDSDKRKHIGNWVGKECSHLIKKNMIEPTYTNPRIKKGYIQLPVNVKIVEVKERQFKLLHI